MKKLLMRAAMSPLDNLSTYEVLSRNTVGDNIGNMLFPYSMFRALMLEDTWIDSYRKPIVREHESINEEYDAFVMPLANAFRPGFMDYLNRLTKLIKKLNIPCVVVGCGLQAPADVSMEDGYPFDKDVKAFVSAVLDKSAAIGVRGEITAEYLKRLGFGSSVVDVIGCPSMYMNGRTLPETKKKKKLSKKSIICYNEHKNFEKFHEFLVKNKRKYPEHYLMTQETVEMELLYAGVSLPKSRISAKDYPTNILHPDYVAGKMRSFVNVPTWRKFMSQADFSYGTRIHGNVAAIQSGIPAFIFPADSRVRELAEYHELPNMLINDMPENLSLEELYETVDFSIIHKNHAKRFDHFIDFLHRNGLETVYDENPSIKETPFDKRIKELDLEPPVVPLLSLSPEEMSRRLTTYGRGKNRRIASLKGELGELKKANNAMAKELAKK